MSPGYVRLSFGLAITIMASPPDRESIMTKSENPDSNEIAAESEQRIATEPFAFHGSGSDYFRIWIVNLLLSILTLGIYSAWAKVRTKRYFYGNTELAGDRFEYLANPVAILKGRLIGVALLIVYSIVGSLSLAFSLASVVVLLWLLPLIVVQSLRFNAYNSAWRGIRFGFDGHYPQSYVAYLLWPIFGLMTFGLGIPWALYKINRFQIDNHRFGTTGSRATATPGGFYRIALISFGVLLILLIVVIATTLIAGVATLPSELTGSPSADPVESDGTIALPELSAFLLVFMLGYLTLLLVVFVSGLLYQAMRFQLVFNNVEIADNKLRNDLSAAGYYWILLSNLLLTIVTLGFFTPWARVRRARYLLSRMWVDTPSLENFAASEADRISARGDEIGEAFDLGIGI